MCTSERAGGSRWLIEREREGEQPVVDRVADWHCRNQVFAAFSSLFSCMVFANVDWDSSGGPFSGVEFSNSWFYRLQSHVRCLAFALLFLPSFRLSLF